LARAVQCECPGCVCSRRESATRQAAKLKPTRQAQLVALWRGGARSTVELDEMFDVDRSTVYRAIQRSETSPAEHHAGTPPAERPKAVAAGLPRARATALYDSERDRRGRAEEFDKKQQRAVTL